MVNTSFFVPLFPVLCLEFLKGKGWVGKRRKRIEEREGEKRRKRTKREEYSIKGKGTME